MGEMGGGTSPEASTENPEASVQRLGGDQSRGIKKSETTTLGGPKKTIAIFGYKQRLLSLDMKTKVVQHVLIFTKILNF